MNLMNLLNLKENNQEETQNYETWESVFKFRRNTEYKNSV